MKKRIIIESEENKDKINRKITIEEYPEKNRNHFTRLIQNKFFEWLLYMVGYAIVLMIVSKLFNKVFYINSDYYGLYYLLSAIIIYILNQTIKPLLFYITLPLTAITFGLFYPILNVIILYLADFILGKNFRIDGIIIPFVIAIIISLLNIVMEGMFIKPIINKGK